MVETINNRYFSVYEANARGDRKRKGTKRRELFHQMQDRHSVWLTRRKRANNQPVVVAAVADGMGGYSRWGFLHKITGKNAAKMAIQTVGEMVKQLTSTEKTTSTLLPQAVKHAGTGIYARYNSHQTTRIGTTLAAVAVKHQQSENNYAVRFASVGDSPIFKIPAYGRLERLTTDDHQAGQRKNVINNTVGRNPTTTISAGNSGERILNHGDQLLLATDGVSNATYVTGRRFQQQYNGLEDFLQNAANWRKVTTKEHVLFGRRVLSAEKLVREARRFRGTRRDDATAVVIRVK